MGPQLYRLYPMKTPHTRGEKNGPPALSHMSDENDPNVGRKKWAARFTSHVRRKRYEHKDSDGQKQRRHPKVPPEGQPSETSSASLG